MATFAVEDEADMDDVDVDADDSDDDLGFNKILLFSFTFYIN